MLDGFSAAVKAALYVAALMAAGISLALASLQPSQAVRQFAAGLIRIAALGVLIFSLLAAGLLMARLGVPSVVAALGGARVLATDWSPEALEVGLHWPRLDG